MDCLTPFDSEMFESRKLLAEKIRSRLDECGFNLETVGDSYEDVYEREVRKGIFVRVYTSVVGPQVRPNGKDAIRVAGVYKSKSGAFRPLASETRINRTGNIEEIVERMVTRMRSVWVSCNSTQTCSKCGAPKFKAKTGNIVCADLCWKN